MDLAGSRPVLSAKLLTEPLEIACPARTVPGASTKSACTAMSFLTNASPSTLGQTVIGAKKNINFSQGNASFVRDRTPTFPGEHAPSATLSAERGTACQSALSAPLSMKAQESVSPVFQELTQ